MLLALLIVKTSRRGKQPAWLPLKAKIHQWAPLKQRNTLDLARLYICSISVACYVAKIVTELLPKPKTLIFIFLVTWDKIWHKTELESNDSKLGHLPTICSVLSWTTDICSDVKLKTEKSSHLSYWDEFFSLFFTLNPPQFGRYQISEEMFWHSLETEFLQLLFVGGVASIVFSL